MPTLKKINGELKNVSEPGSSDAVGTEADILARINRGEIKRGSLIDITDDEEDDEITSLQVTHGNDTLKNVLDSIDTDLAGKQSKTLSQQIAGQSTVEGALGAMQPKALSQSVAGQNTVEGALNKVDSKLELQNLVAAILESYQGRYLLYFHETESRESAEESYFRVDFDPSTKVMTCTKRTQGTTTVVGSVSLRNESTALTLQNCTGQGTAYRNGNMVTVNLEITATASGNIVINYLPEVYKTQTGNAIAFNSSGSKAVGYTTNGVITIYGANSGDSYYIHFTAPAKNYT